MRPGGPSVASEPDVEPGTEQAFQLQEPPLPSQEEKGGGLRLLSVLRDHTSI